LKSARISPFDGEAFFTSAISAYSPFASLLRIAVRKPRGAVAAFACASTLASGCARLEAAISSRL